MTIQASDDIRLHSGPVPKKRPAQREIELDFIRGIAILLVIDLHSPHSFLARPLASLGFPPIGGIGVDIFFVLSGFLVGGLLMKEWKVRRGIDAKRFLARRAFKIWPQYYVFLIATVVLGHLNFSALWGNLLNIQNYTEGIVHTWSLAVEEHVYLFLLICFVVASRWKTPLRAFFDFFCVLCVLAIVLRYVLVTHGQHIYYPTHARFDGILYGVLLAMLYHFAPDKFHRLRSLRLLWLVCFVLGFLGLRDSAHQTWREALHQDAANLVAISLLMLLYRRPKGQRGHSLPYRCVAWIGIYSYGIYLWHVAAIRPVMAFSQGHPGIPGPIVAVAILAAAIGIGAFTSRLIEFPALHLRDRLFPRRVDSAVGTPAEMEAPEAMSQA